MRRLIPSGWTQSQAQYNCRAVRGLQLRQYRVGLVLLPGIFASTIVAQPNVHSAFGPLGTAPITFYEIEPCVDPSLPPMAVGGGYDLPIGLRAIGAGNITVVQPHGPGSAITIAVSGNVERRLLLYVDSNNVLSDEHGPLNPVSDGLLAFPSLPRGTGYSSRPAPLVSPDSDCAALDSYAAVWQSFDEPYQPPRWNQRELRLGAALGQRWLIYQSGFYDRDVFENGLVVIVSWKQGEPPN